MTLSPEPDSFHLKWAGDLFEVTLRLDRPREGRAAFRTNLGRARVRRQELIGGTESGEPVHARDWHDIPMRECAPGVFRARIPLTEVGVFEGKACFFAGASAVPEWPEGGNLRVKVEPAHTACANTVYTAFVRQFGASLRGSPRTPDVLEREAALDALGYTVIPPSGTFRDLARRLDTVMDTLRFRIVQLLPVHPVPVSYGRMGRYGSAFAALDFLSVDPALAEFDTRATPLDQFGELVDAVHSRGGTLFMDLPANHTGWAATLQTHHPDWYRRRPDGEFVSPGAWGVTWADLVELDYRDPRLRAYMAKVFLFWCSQGVDGFRCDAGYMIPAETWTYIVARVREEFPDTVFLLEGLGGQVEVTEALLTASNLNWAYSELFQTDDRGAMEWYLPRAIRLAERCGPLIHFAETHDNNRLAARGGVYARLRVALSALLSHQGAFGITNGVEWFAAEKVDVHGAAGLNWDAPENQVADIARLNALLEQHPAFGPGTRLAPATAGEGPVLAVARAFGAEGRSLLVLVNFDCEHAQTVRWDAAAFGAGAAWDLLTGEAFAFAPGGGLALAPGRVCCLTADAEDFDAVVRPPESVRHDGPADVARRRRNLMALRVRLALAPEDAGARFAFEGDPDRLGAAMTADPDGFCQNPEGGERSGLPRRAAWNWPEDARRRVMVPEGHVLLVRAEHPFRAELKAGGRTLAGERAVRLDDGRWGAFLPVAPCAAGLDGTRAEARSLVTTVYTPGGVRRAVSEVLALPPAGAARVVARVGGGQVRAEGGGLLRAALSNGAGAAAQARAAWGGLRSQYDCLLAVNPDPRVPADRMVFWTRCRTWLRYRGFSQEIDPSCLDAFEADPAGRFAEWSFRVPCGMGRWVPLRFRLELAPGVNRARLTLARGAACEGGLPDRDEVTVVARPDVEWRSFHQKTKAFLGPETAWPAAVRPGARGFTFHPAADVALALAAEGGAAAFHAAPEWAYMVAHPEEQERGLEGSGDLFSPGWFELTLPGGGSAALSAWREGEGGGAEPEPAQGGEAPLAIPEAMSRALSLYIVRRDALKTVIAGYPWFLDWGRDTLIALRGLIADGRHGEALAILQEFGRFEENGTLPNIIHGNTVGNRDTSDAPLWFCVAAGELMEAAGDREVLEAACGGRPLREVLVSIVAHTRDGTPNGIRMDPESGLVYSPPHFTWMDTNYPAATPREGYPVEIQALWIASLRLVARKVDAGWMALAEQAARSLARLFAVKGGWLADCLGAAAGVPAEQAVADEALRPNQLLALTLNVPLARDIQCAVVAACETLLVPGAIRSLADAPVPAGAYPYCGRYEGDEDTRRKLAYHNGTAWTWQFPLYVEALVGVYGESARAAGLSLLGSAVELLNRGCLGHAPEICDGDAPHLERGCGAQAWGVSELLRVWKRVAGAPPPDSRRGAAP
ncbi:MAG: glycogen debranching enzyme N-terminal domain-containing protein [Verrucomicrobiota bacterium]|jgi:glycogen debranching enzyme|nr:glycogen debranching enzyme N-terminal domain-containing protein [Verrucomicrobiota bacterium]